jgi:hypothetical protein
MSDKEVAIAAIRQFGQIYSFAAELVRLLGGVSKRTH